MIKVLESKVKFTDGGDVIFESNDAATFYNKMFSDFREAVVRNEKWDGNLDTFFTTPSPYDGAKKEGYEWGIERAETPQFVVEITTDAIEKGAESSTHLATFYKKC